MTLNPNQFKLTSVQGDLDLGGLSQVISCHVSSNQSTGASNYPLVAGQPVKLDTAGLGGGTPPVLALAANTDESFGFVIRTLKDQDFVLDAAVEVALAGSVMQMTSGAAITLGSTLEVQYATNTVITNAGTNPVIGFALNSVTGTGLLLRVFIMNPLYNVAQTIADISGLQSALNVLTAAAAASVQLLDITVTQAQLNAGQVLIAGIAGKSISVIDVQATFTGTFAAGTAMVLEDTSAVIVDTLALAGMAAGVVRMPLPNAIDTHQTLGAGAAVPLTSGAGLQLVKSGSNFTGGTAIVLQITYKQA